MNKHPVLSTLNEAEASVIHKALSSPGVLVLFSSPNWNLTETEEDILWGIILELHKLDKLNDKK